MPCLEVGRWQLWLVIHNQITKKMAIQTGNIKYRGSFKSIRQWKNAHNPNIYAGEKGGANRELVLNNPAFARTRENMNEFGGCGIVVKDLRRGLQELIPDHVDTRFTGRLMSLVKKINLEDVEGIRGKRSIHISLKKSILNNLTLHEKRKVDFQLKKSIRSSHTESRTAATINVSRLNPDPKYVPSSTEYFRVFMHLCVVSDYVCAENGKDYKPINVLNTKSVLAYSDYIPINTPMNTTVNAAFEEDTVLTETTTVLQCVGIEYYIRSGGDTYLPFKQGSTLVFDVF